MAPTVLLVSRAPPSTALMDRLESSGLCVEATNSRRLERTLGVVGPDLVVHLGWAGSHDVVAVLARRAARRPLVLVVDRDRLLEARDMDREIVASVLSSDLSVEKLAERIARLTTSAGQGSSRPERRAATTSLPASAAASEEDGDCDDERPTLLIQDVPDDERPTLHADDEDRPTLIADDDERPTLIADDDERPTLAIEGAAPEGAAIDGEPTPGTAAQPAVPHRNATGQRRAASSLVVVLGIALLGAGGWWWSRRADGGPPSNVSLARPVVEHAIPTQREDGETSAIERSELPATLEEPVGSPWEVPESSGGTTCEALVDPEETLPRGDVAQASRYWEKARAALILGDVQKAQGWMCRAVHVYPQSLAVEGLAESYLNLGAPREAKRWIDVAMAHRPERPRTLELLGDIENQLGDVERSRTLWLRALQIPDEEEATLALLARDQMNKADAALRSGDAARAEVHYRRAAVLRPQSDAGPLGLARVARMREDGERAALWVKEALRRNPSSPEGLRLKGEAAVQ